ncbi:MULTISPECIES: LEA type 2 family protein [Halorussus]|uniref:LEA type 2 family protein n=1 Tax=Halorussus TaxID=1070314 RepID=UPI00209C8142|nr:LEA type 2 family protein [Halorussus vallis]USZ76276.1 LEA type 2 family protein [Halorussus vallis]
MFGLFKSLLLGSKIRVLLAVVAALAIVAAGGVSIGVLGAPSVAGVENRFGNVTDETTEIHTDLAVHNPNPFGVKFGDVTVSYDVRMNGIRLANGTKQGVAVGAGNSTVPFRSTVHNEKMPAWWVSHVRNGEQTTVRVDASVTSGTLGRTFSAPPVKREVSTDIISQFNSTEPRPVNASQPFVSDPVAYVNETSARWGQVTSAETPIDMRFVVYNPKATPLVVTQIGYNVTMNDVAVGNGTTDREHLIEGGTQETIDARSVIRNEKLDEWWVTHLRNDQVTNLTIDFYAKVELGGQTYRVPLSELTYTKTIETDIFGTKNETAAGSSEATSTTAADESGSETTADEGRSTSSEPTATTTDQTSTTDETSTTEENGTTSERGTDGESGTTTDGGLLALGSSALR